MLGTVCSRTNAFFDSIKYITNQKKATHTFSGGVSSIDDAHREMMYVASMTASEKKTCSHYAFTLPEYEKLSNEQFEDVIKTQLEALGLSNHQYVAAVHSDTIHQHVHLVVNCVSPDNFRHNAPFKDFFTIDRTCRELELKHGLSHDKNIYCVEYAEGNAFIIEKRDRKSFKEMSNGANKIERYSENQGSFEMVVSEKLTMVSGLSDTLKPTMEWQDIHDNLRRKLGLEIIKSQHDVGLVFKDIRTGKCAKTSLMRDFRKYFPPEFSYVADINKLKPEVKRVLDELTKMQSSFTENDLDSYLNAFVEDSRANEIKRAVLESEDCIHLKATEKGMARFTSKTVMREESDAMETARRLSLRQGATPTPRSIQAALAAMEKPLRTDQLDAFHKALECGVLAPTIGRAGVGKSYVMSPLRATYERDGYKVIALGPTNKIRLAELKDGFKEAYTIDTFKYLCRSGKLKLDSKTVIMIDETSMISNDKMKELFDIADRSNIAKLCMFGDDRQLPAVERSGLFGDCVSEFGAGEITKIVRQKELRQNQAAQYISEGMFEKGMLIYHEEGRIKWSNTDDDSRDKLIDTYINDYQKSPHGKHFAISYTNEDVDYLNEQIHNEMLAYANPNLHSPNSLMTAHGVFEFCINEEIQLGKNDKKLGITNGAKAKILAWTNDGMTVSLDGGKTIELSLTGKDAFIDFRHSYAGSVYKSQGESIENVYLHHSSHYKDAAGYVALTRGTHETKLFAARETACDFKEIARQMQQTMQKSSAISIGVSDTKHEFKTVQHKITQEAAKKIEIINEARKVDIAEPKLPEKFASVYAAVCNKSSKKELYKRYNEFVRADNEALISNVKFSRNLRDSDVRNLREKRSIERKNLSNKDVHSLRGFDAETKHLVAVVKSQYKNEIDSFTKDTGIIDFSSWLIQQTDDAAVSYSKRQKYSERDKLYKVLSKDSLIDLNDVMAENKSWKIQHSDDKSIVKYGLGDKSIIVKCDAGGHGIRWFCANDKAGGTYASLLKQIDRRDLIDTYREKVASFDDGVENKKKIVERCADVNLCRTMFKPALKAGHRVEQDNFYQTLNMKNVLAVQTNVMGIKYDVLCKGNNRNATAFELVDRSEGRSILANGSNQSVKHLNEINRIRCAADVKNYNIAISHEDVKFLRSVVNDNKITSISSDDYKKAIKIVETLKTHEKVTSAEEKNLVKCFGTFYAAEQVRLEAIAEIARKRIQNDDANRRAQRKHVATVTHSRSPWDR